MILCVTRCEAFHLAGYRKVTYLYRTVLVVVRYGFVQEVDKMMHHVCQVKCKFKASPPLMRVPMFPANAL